MGVDMYIVLLACLAAALSYSNAVAQEKATQPDAGKGESKTPSKTMKLYDVPPAREATSEAPEEVADYFKITQTQDSAQRVSLIEDFLKKYPDSKYNPTLHQLAAANYQQLNNYEKLVEHGEKSLQLLPASPTLLSVLALAYAYHGESDKAIDRAGKSITLLEKLTAPTDADAARFTTERNHYLSSNYACLGTAFLSKYESARKERLAKVTPTTDGSVGKPPGGEVSSAVGESSKDNATPQANASGSTPENESILLAKAQAYFTRALELSSKYEFAQFQMGVVYAYQNRAEQAMQAFARTIALGGSFAEMGRQNLEAVYKVTHKNSLEGIEDLIAKAKEAENAAKAEEGK